MLSLDTLVELVHALRAKGYDVGTQECLNAGRLLLALQAHGTLDTRPERLARVLAPVFCSSRAEQEAFLRDFVQWMQQRAPALAPAAQGDGRVGPGPGLADGTGPGRGQPHGDAPAAPWWTPRRLAAAAMSVAVLAAAAALVPDWLPRQARLTVATPKAVAVQVSSPCDDCRIERQGDGSYTLTYRRRQLPVQVQAQAPGLCAGSALLDDQAAVQASLSITLLPEPCVAEAAPEPVRKSDVLPTVTGREQATMRPVPDLDWQVTAAALPALVGVLALLLLGRRARLALSSAERAQAPQITNLRLAGSSFVLFDRATLRRIAQEFRRHRPRPSQDIDGPATVSATVARGGVFTPVLLQRKALPEYLVLIDQAGARDHQARWAQELVSQLALGGVVVDRYFYNRDPRHLQTAFDRPGRTSAADLLARFGDHVLMVFGDGEAFFDPLTQEMQPWLQGFAAWERRVLVTPLPQHRWGWREAALRSAGFVIAPADLGGLQIVASMAEVFRPTGQVPRRYPPLLASGDGRWLERGAPAADEVDRLAGQLKWFLSPSGYQWLGALALYPQLQWDITLHLGLRLLPDEGRVRMLLAELIQLPWLRQGQMPPWLRRRLVADLSPQTEVLARQAYLELLGTEGAAEGFLQPVASDDAALSRGARLRAALRRWRQHVQGQDAARRSHPESPLRDYVFVSFMRGGRPGQLEMEAPASWSRLFERGWLPEARHALAAVLLAALCGGGLWWAAGQTMTRPQEVSALYLQPSIGLLVRVAGERTTWIELGGAQVSQGAPRTPQGDLDQVFQQWSQAAARSAVASTADGAWTAVADPQGDITVKPSAAGVVRAGHNAGGTVDPRVFALSADGRRLLYARPGGAITLVSWLEGGGVTVWPAAAAYGRSVFAVANTHVALARADGSFEVFALDARGGVPRAVPIEKPPGTVTALALSADGQRLAAAFAASGILQWSLDEPTSKPRLVELVTRTVRQLAYTPDGTLLATGSDDGSVRLWDPATQESLLLPSGGPPARIVQMAIQGDRLRVAAADERARLMVWSLSPPAVAPLPAATAPPPAASSAPPSLAEELARAAVEVRYCRQTQRAAAQRVAQALTANKSVASANLVFSPRESDRLADNAASLAEVRHARTLPGPAMAALLAGILSNRVGARFTLSSDPRTRPGALTVVLCDPEAGPTPAELREAQVTLQKLYGSAIPTDGVMNATTAGALQRFQQERKLPVTGRLDAATVDALGAVRLAALPKEWPFPAAAATSPASSASASDPVPVTGWCCTRQPIQSPQQQQQQQPPAGVATLTETSAAECAQNGGRYARSRAEAQTLCRVTDSVRLLSLRTLSGGALVLSPGADVMPAKLIANVEVTLAQGPATLQLELRQSFTSRGTCEADGRIVDQTSMTVSESGPKAVTLTLPYLLPDVFIMPGYLGLTGRLVSSGKERSLLATAERAQSACLAYQLTPPQDAVCRVGFVPRGAYDGDPVCVTPATRQQVLADNAAAAKRRQPGGGVSGPNTCRRGWVWREAGPNDVVCVTPEVRQQTAEDNSLMQDRRAPPRDATGVPAR